MNFLERLEFDPQGARDQFFRTGLDVLKKGGKALAILNPPTTASGLGSTKLKGDVLDTLERVAMDGSFKYYGNWGGPLYSAGKYYKKNQIITKEDIQKNPPQDKLDELFLKHDLRYQRAATNNTAEDRKRGLRYADELFIKEAEDLLKSQETTLKEKIAGKAAILAFKGKLATDIGYNADQIIDPEARKVVNEYFGQVDNDAPIKEHVYVAASGLQQNQQDTDYSEQTAAPSVQPRKDIETIQAIQNILYAIDDEDIE